MQELRTIPLLAVLEFLGFSSWKSRKEGTEWYGKCVIHNPKNNNNSFSFDAEKFHCFSCGAKGKGAIDLVKAVRNCSYQDAIELLKNVRGRPVPPPIVVTRTENPPFRATYSKYFVESTWLKERGFTQGTLDYFGVGEYNNPNRVSQYKGRILFPIKRLDGEVVGYLARNPQPHPDEPKYLFPQGVMKGLELFGAFQLRQNVSLPLRVGYLLESPLAVMKFHQLGLAACSPYGWAVSPQQVSMLSQLFRGVVYLPDSNVRENVATALHLLSSRMWVKCPEYPGADPEYLTKEQIQGLT